jgi:tetratricopeptide (TPR) repeat protein
MPGGNGENDASSQEGDSQQLELLARAAHRLRRFRQEGLREEGEIEGAAEELAAYLEKNPQSVPALRLLADCAIILERWDLARRLIARAERLDPWNLEILIIAESLVEPPGADAETEGTRLSASSLRDLLVDPAELSLRAKGAFRLGQLDRAYSLAKLAWLLDQQQLAYLLDLYGIGAAADPERTRRELELMVQQDPPPSIFLALGAVCNVLARYTEALEWLAEGVRRAGEEDVYLRALLLNETAYVMVKMGVQLDRAVTIARAALELFPDQQNNGFIRDTLGSIYLKMGDYQKAELNLREAVEKDSSAICRFHLALVLLAQGRAAECLEEMRKLVVCHPSLESPHVEEIMILERVQNHFSRLEQLLQLGGAEELAQARQILRGLL